MRIQEGRRPNPLLNALHATVEADAKERELRKKAGEKFRFIAGETVYLYGPVEPTAEGEFPIVFEPGTVVTPKLEFDTATGKITTHIEAQLIENPYGYGVGASFSKLDLVTQATDGTEHRTGVEIETITGLEVRRNLVESSLPSSTDLEKAIEIIKSFPQRYLAAGVKQHDIGKYITGTWFAIVAHS